MSKSKKDMAPEGEDSAQSYGFEKHMRGKKHSKRGSKRKGRRKGGR